MVRQKNKERRDSGQALLFVVVAMTIALSVGVAISSRTLQMSSRTSRTDTSARVLAAAEGGIDRLLDQPESFLDALSSGMPNCGTGGFDAAPGDSSRCIINYTPDSGDPITSRAVLSAQTFRHTDVSGTTGYYSFDLVNNQTKTVNITGMSTFRICWNNPGAVIEYILYGDTVTRQFLKPAGFVNNDISSTGFLDAGSIGGVSPLPYCYDVESTGNNYRGVRIRSIFQGTKVAVVPINPNVLPLQGYRLYSRGELVQEGDVKVTKAIVVYRSYSTAPSFFDYAIFTNDEVP